MRSTELDIDLDNVDADGIAQSQTPTTVFTLNGALGTTLDYARIVLFTSAGDESGKDITLSGTDADGNSISEVIVGPNTTAVSTLFYKTVSSIAVSSAFGGNCTVGTIATTSVAVSPSVPLNFYDQVPPTINVDVTGTIDFTVQETFDAVLSTGSASATWADITALTDKTADTTAQTTRGATAIRVLINSYSNGAELQANIVSIDNSDNLLVGSDVQAYDTELEQIADLADPNADRILFWDDSAGAYAYLTASTGLTITGTNITASGSGLTEFTSASASGPASLYFSEDTDNGTNKITVIAPASVGSDVVMTLPVATDTFVGKATSDVFTNKTFDADGSGNSISNIENADIKAAAAIAVNKLAAVTVSRALVSDGSGFVSAATTTSTEIGYVNGVTSAIQTQINTKLPAGVQADQETGTSNVVAVTPGIQHFHQSAAKFWCVANTSGTVLASYNVTSITDTGVGMITVTIATDFSGASWHGQITINEGGTFKSPQIVSQTAGTVLATCCDIQAIPALSDPSVSWNLSGFGDQA